MIKVFVMNTCPDCEDIEGQIKNDSRFELIDISKHIRNLKQFLKLRDSHPAFDKVKKQGAVGIPCFLLEDGAISFRPEDVGLRSDVESIGAVCNLDGSGC